MPNFAALRAVVFPLSTKNLRGADIRPPSVRGLSPLLSPKLLGLLKNQTAFNTAAKFVEQNLILL